MEHISAQSEDFGFRPPLPPLRARHDGIFNIRSEREEWLTSDDWKFIISPRHKDLGLHCMFIG